MLAAESVLIFFVMRMLLTWNRGRPIYLILASASAVLLYVTKETAFITHGTMLIAAGCVVGWRFLVSKEAIVAKKKSIAAILSIVAALIGFGVAISYRDDLKGYYESFYANFSGVSGPDQKWVFIAILLTGVLAAVSYAAYISFMDGEGPAAPDRRFWKFDPEEWKRLDWILAGVACSFVFVYLLVLFFTSFFKYPGDFTNFFSAYAFWAETGSSDHTQSGSLGYAKWLLQIEGPLAFLSVLGTLIAVVKARKRFALFTGLWAFGLFLAYSIISYKTPWLALSFTLPMAIVGGYAVNELLASKARFLNVTGCLLAGLSVVVLAFQSYDLNFVRYDDESLPYVYAHTRRGFEDLVRDAKGYADKSLKKKDAAIEIVSDEYWPMPWYFNDYPNARFHGRLVESATSEIVIAKSKQIAELPELYSRHYKYVRTYPLRPGVDLLLLVRNDLAGSAAKSIYDIEN